MNHEAQEGVGVTFLLFRISKRCQPGAIIPSEYSPQHSLPGGKAFRPPEILPWKLIEFPVLRLERNDHAHVLTGDCRGFTCRQPLWTHASACARSIAASFALP